MKGKNRKTVTIDALGESKAEDMRTNALDTNERQKGEGSMSGDSSSRLDVDLAVAALDDDIHIDKQNKRLVGVKSGVYMTFFLFDREENEWTFALSNATAPAIFVARVKRHGFSQDPTAGGATNVSYMVREVWFPRGDGREPERYYGDTIWMNVLCKFLAVHKYYHGVKTPDPVFGFVDSR